MKKLFTILAIALLCGACCGNNPVSPEVDQHILNPKDRATRDRFDPLTDSGIVWIDVNH